MIGASSGIAVTSESGTISAPTLYSDSSNTFAIISRSSALISGLSDCGSDSINSASSSRVTNAFSRSVRVIRVISDA